MQRWRETEAAQQRRSFRKDSGKSKTGNGERRVFGKGEKRSKTRSVEGATSIWDGLLEL